MTIFDGFGSPFGGHFGSILEPCRHLAGKSGHTDSQKGGLERGPESGSQKKSFWYLPGGRQECSLSYDSSIFSFSSLSLLAPFWAPFWSHFGSQVRHYTPFWPPGSPTGARKSCIEKRLRFWEVQGLGGVHAPPVDGSSQSVRCEPWISEARGEDNRRGEPTQ